jgi:hypothetical protein
MPSSVFLLRVLLMSLPARCGTGVVALKYVRTVRKPPKNQDRSGSISIDRDYRLGMMSASGLPWGGRDGAN